MKEFLSITVFICILMSMPVVANASGSERMNVISDTVGKIVKIRKSWVYVLDDSDKKTRRFFINKRLLAKFTVGDVVRVNYDDSGVVSIKKMTILECKEGQNLGIVSGCI